MGSMSRSKSADNNKPPAPGFSGVGAERGKQMRYRDNYGLEELPALLTIKECADVCRVTTKTINRWIGEGRIKSFKLTDGPGSSKRLVPRNELIKMLRESECSDV
jgi:excisionase family DNA binding protein